MSNYFEQQDELVSEITLPFDTKGMQELLYKYDTEQLMLAMCREIIRLRQELANAKRIIAEMHWLWYTIENDRDNWFHFTEPFRSSNVFDFEGYVKPQNKEALLSLINIGSYKLLCNKLNEINNEAVLISTIRKLKAEVDEMHEYATDNTREDRRIADSYSDWGRL